MTIETNRTRTAFTLIELLVVISIIATLAAFTIPVMGSIKKSQQIKHATGEMELIETALERYKADYGFYPPCNTNNSLVQPLFYELVGTTNVAPAGAPNFQPLDGSPTVSALNYSNQFNLGGVMNCSQGNGEDTKKARTYLTDLKPGQVANNGTVTILVTSANAYDGTPLPLPGFTTGTGYPAIPFRYVCPGTNNPNSYDLWIQLEIKQTKYLICNWSKQVVVNSSMP